jgi:hypothetical protein
MGCGTVDSVPEDSWLVAAGHIKHHLHHRILGEHAEQAIDVFPLHSQEESPDKINRW